MAAMSVRWDLPRWRWLGYGGIAILAGIEINEIARGHLTSTAAVATVAFTGAIAVAWIPLMIRFQRDRRSPSAQS
jgi:hypothetical protein